MNIVDKEKLVTKLASEYYCAVSDHKDRDCHFYISTTIDVRSWSYGKRQTENRPCYVVEHFGYCNKLVTKIGGSSIESDEFSFSSYEEALDFLISNLEEFIRNEKDNLSTLKKR